MRIRAPLASTLTGLLAGILVATGGSVAAVSLGPAADAGPAVRTGVRASSPAAGRLVHYRQWSTTARLRRGERDGVRVSRGRAQLDRPRLTHRIGGRAYDVGTWTSPWVEPGFAFTELIPSWSARTPGDSVVEVRVRGRSASGRVSSWDLMARWAAGDRHLHRTTSSGQDDDLGDVNVDTWRTSGLTAWRVRVSLARAAGSRARPFLDTVGAVASRLPAGVGGSSRPGVARGTVLDVPRYSQMAHSGHFPQWGGGGEAWCSPTATSMVLGYYDTLPRPRAYRWVGSGHVDPWVDHAARMTYDHSYDGTGNWPFNTAYAAPRAGHAFVTRLRSLREAERFVAAGVPLVASVSFGAGELDGAPISSTAGHLLVIAGFTASGDVVVNDPASRDRAGVRRTYDRAQLERAWLGGSGGLVYVIHDTEHPLPRPAPENW